MLQCFNQNIEIESGVLTRCAANPGNFPKRFSANYGWLLGLSTATPSRVAAVFNSASAEINV